VATRRDLPLRLHQLRLAGELAEIRAAQLRFTEDETRELLSAAGVKAHLDTVTERAAAPIIAKYTGVLAAANIEVFTTTTTFAIMQSLRLDRGPSGPVHP
jgi:hypothetical protein